MLMKRARRKARSEGGGIRRWGARTGLLLAFAALCLAMLESVIMQGGPASSPLAGAIHAAHAADMSGMSHAGPVSAHHHATEGDCPDRVCDDRGATRIPQGSLCCPLACVALLPGCAAPVAGPVVSLANVFAPARAAEGWGSPPEPPTPPPRPA
jgi:hypothetical protein